MSRAGVVGVLVGVLSVAGIAAGQGRLAAEHARTKTKADIFYLPPASQLKRMTLGYDSAACDILWAKLLVEYGRHWSEHRELEHNDLVRFLDGLLVLDKDFVPIYRYVDTLLVYRPLKGERRDAEAARRYLEEGTRLRPRDPNVWLHYGEFVSYLGPAWLDDETEREAWRRDGALAIVNAVELGAKADRTLAAVSLLGRAGEREAARKALERAYAVADDDDTRDRVRAQLDKLDASAHADERERRRLAIEKRRVRALPFVSPTTFLLVGPGSSPLACVGPGSSARPECPTDWTTALAEP
ncbi:MAG: hypothetical protein JNM74_20195 [Myxococcales bacterium]|nr:hypothetical protein [Myxococcales bacterium]